MLTHQGKPSILVFIKKKFYHLNPTSTDHRLIRRKNNAMDPKIELIADLYVWGHLLVVMHRTRAAPAGPYMLGLRVYEGLNDVVNATWFPPPLTRT